MSDEPMLEEDFPEIPSSSGKNETVVYDGLLWEVLPSSGSVVLPKSGRGLHHSEECQHLSETLDYPRVEDPDGTLWRRLVDAATAGPRAVEEFARSKGLVNLQGQSILWPCTSCVLRQVHENGRGAGSRRVERLSRALAAFDRSAFASEVAEAKEQIERVQREFPREEWPTMPLERYALGQPDHTDTFCRLLEFQSSALGSIRGGSAGKHIIYYRRSEQRWRHDPAFADVAEAWTDLRQGFAEAFTAVEQGRISDIDDIDALRSGPALVGKTLFCYFPDQLLPIYSRSHLRHFVELLSGGKASALGAFAAHQRLKELVQAHHELSAWHPLEVVRFLYSWADPRKSVTTVRIASPGPEQDWDDCLAGGYVSVGWDAVGDLTEYVSEEDFTAAFQQSYTDLYKGNQGVTAKKAGELWQLTRLHPGDRVVATRGTDTVLAVGTVTDDAYRWRADRAKSRHTVAVRWDTSFAKTLDKPEKHWATTAVSDVSASLWKVIEKDTGALSAEAGDDRPEPRPLPPDPLFDAISVALERKGQAVLYGPPGTGKTFSALRFALRWLVDRLALNLDPLAEYGTREFRDALAELSTSTAHDVGNLTQITFHPSYGYEDFIEGFRPAAADDGDSGGLRLELVDGIFKRVCRAAAAHPDQPYLLIIDEINRGDMPKILGELITLIERDKRGLTTVLPQSGQTFSVPANVYVLGTMNTADRSVRLLDSALRRRFAFIELLPDPGVLEGTHVGKLNLGDLLRELNTRVLAVLGRERQIGHSFFISGGTVVDNEADLAAVLRAEVLPILQEYAYDDYTLLATFLGPQIVDAARHRLHDLDDEALIEALYAELLVRTER